MSFKKVIGHVTFDAPFISRETYETAAWFMDVKCPAGTYEIYAYFKSQSDYEEGTYNRSFINAKGVVVQDNFAPLWGGVRIPTDNVTTYVGQEKEVHELPYQPYDIVLTEEFKGILASRQLRYEQWIASDEYKALMKRLG